MVLYTEGTLNIQVQINNILKVMEHLKIMVRLSDVTFYYTRTYPDAAIFEYWLIKQLGPELNKRV